MAARLPSTLRTAATPRIAASVLRPSISQQTQRAFRTSIPRLQETVIAAPPVVRKPVGAFRGTLFGFLLGSVLAGSGLYYYVIDEYKVSNELLTEDIYVRTVIPSVVWLALQAAVQRLEIYVKGVEEGVKTGKK
ncbi:hypothetical protein LTR53_016965 [Teratosphaeriaceae sp. CCFEE 6253]|nr:hypothetical protein LTR53_016965 [Teratosphaeriaceae sp. CCFEE 6253]